MIGAPIGAAMYEKFQPLGVQLRLGESFGRYSPFVGCAVCVIAGFLLSLKILHEPKEVEALPTEHDVTVEGESLAVEPEDQPEQSEQEPDLEVAVPVEEVFHELNDETHATPKQ